MTEQEKQEIIQALKEELSKELLVKKSSLASLRPYTIINICLISDILQKYNHFLAEMLGDSIFFRTFAPFLKTI